MPTARRIEIPISGDCPSFHGDKHSTATDGAAAETDDRRNNGDISNRTRGNDVSVTETDRRLKDHFQRESNGESKEHLVDRDEQLQCSKENAKKIDENVTRKQSQELVLQKNVSSLGQKSTQSVLRTRSSSKYEGPVQHTLHGDDKNYDERTGMREVNVDLDLDNQNPQQQQSNAPTHLASGQSTTTGQDAQNFNRPREPQPQQSQPEDELTRNPQLLAQQKLLSRKNHTSQTHQEECDSNLSQSTNRLASKWNVSLQQKVHSESKEHQVRNGPESQEVSIESLQQNMQTVGPSFVPNLQQRSQPGRQPQTHRDEVLMQKAQQNLQKINFPLNHPQWQQEHQQPQLSSLTKRLYPNGFRQDEVPHQEYQHHRETHQLNSNLNNSSESAESYQQNYHHQASQLHISSQNILNHTTWQCTRCYQVHPSFIKSCPCVYGSKSHSDQSKITYGAWQRRAPHQHQGQQQQRPRHHQYNDRARSTGSDFQPPNQIPLVQNTTHKPQWQQHHYQHLDLRQLNNREKSPPSDFEPLLVECPQKLMVPNNLPQTTFVNSLSHANHQSSLSNVNEPRHRTKKVAHRQFHHDSGSALIDLTSGNEGPSKNESKYFNSHNVHGPRPGNQASLSQRLNIRPTRQGEMGSNQNDGGSHSDAKRQSVNAHETTISTHNATHRAKHTHDINANRTIRAPKSMNRAIENATSLPQLEGLRHHLKMMLEKVEDKINRALFDMAMDEFDSTNVYASADQMPSYDDMACDPNEARLQRQACCPICFSFEVTADLSSPNSTKRPSSPCPICEEPNTCQDCLSKCNFCQRVCCLDCIQTCDNCALHFCSDCPGYCMSGDSGGSTPKIDKAKRLCKKCVVSSMSGSWVKNAGVQYGISWNYSSNPELKRKRSNEISTPEKRAKSSSSRAALTQYMPRQPIPTQKTSQSPGSINEASKDPTSQHANYAVCHKFIIQHEGKLGVHITADPKNPMCTIISRVDSGSPADIYGLKAGDQIVHHDENPNVKRTYKVTKDWLTNRLKRRPTSITVLRRCLGEGSERHSIYALDATGGKRPLKFEGDFCASIHRFVFNDDRDLGMSIDEWPSGHGYSYTIVKNVESGSLAETHGIRKGDIICKITEDGRLLSCLSQWITTKIRGKPPFRFEILRLHKIENNQQPKDKICEFQQVDSSKINVLPKESNESKNQNSLSAGKETNGGQTVACYLSTDSKSEQTNVSGSPIEPIIEEPISVKTSQNSQISNGDNVRCSEDPVNDTDPSHLDDNLNNPTHRGTTPGQEVHSNGSMPNSPHEKTYDISSFTNTHSLESFQTVLNNLVHKSNPTYKIGTKLWKKFLDNNGKRRLFEGTIESYDPNEGFYKIVYEDGDEEELTERQVSKLLQKKKKTTDENRPLLIGELSLVKKDGKYLHSIRGYWHFENHPRIPSQTFELLRKDLSDEVFSTDKPLAANGEYYGSFVYEWKDPNSKETLTAVIKESKVVIDFAKEGQEGESFLIKGKGINQYGIFELNGQASKDTKSDDSVYQIRMHKTYLKPDTVK